MVLQFAPKLETMKELINYLSAAFKAGPLVHELQQAPLSGVPFHQDTDSITRYFSSSFPVHLAVHEVSPVILPPPEYTQLHSHPDSDEINIVISNNTLLYRIHLDGEEMIVTNNSAVWIPRNTIHSANVLEGSGFFVTLRINHERKISFTA